MSSMQLHIQGQCQNGLAEERRMQRENIDQGGR